MRLWGRARGVIVTISAILTMEVVPATVLSLQMVCSLKKTQHGTFSVKKLERALDNNAPLLELTIQSSATLIKGEKI